MSSEFWDWFRKNSEALKRIRSADAREYTELQRRVAEMSPDIEAEIGGNSSGDDFELIFTAHGEQRFFSLIDQIVRSAPLVSGWHIRALKPPLLENFSIQFGSQKVATREIWLQIHSNPGAEQLLRLNVAIRREDEAEQVRERESAALLAIESFLGERAYASRISVEGFVDLPNDPAAEGYVSLGDVATRLRLSRLQ